MVEEPTCPVCGYHYFKPCENGQLDEEFFGSGYYHFKFQCEFCDAIFGAALTIYKTFEL